ncbi:MAG: tyrosine--tRNA ligase [Planctomycetota bacterium]|nr:MAG: tyrosine--tRNA ligase [Planctomycetota bacterium]
METVVSSGNTTEALLAGTVACHSSAELSAKLKRGTPLRVKFGVDPSSPDLHLGHAVPLRYLRRWQDAGHLAVLLLGDATAMVGDPTGKNATRPQLTREQVEAHAATYLEQAFHVLDPERTEVVRNSDWFDQMNFMDAIKLGATTTVARMLERDTFETRYKAGVPISLHEFLYPLMQARDSVEVRADVEIGGSDQTFNLLAGRDQMRDAGMEPQICITLPLLVGLDGEQKMSKSLGNAIGLTDEPREMFGRAMSLPDALMPSWFQLTTSLSEARVAELLAGSPREAKGALAAEIVATYHGEAAAREASEEFDRIFRDKGLPDDIPSTRLQAELVEDGSVWIVKALTSVGLAASSGEARRLIRSGGVRADDEKVSDEQARLSAGGSYLLRVGKRRFHRVEVPA